MPERPDDLPDQRPSSLVPGEPAQPSNQPVDEMVESEPLGDSDAVLENESRGPASLGGGYYPDPDTPPAGSAPADGAPERGHGTFDEAYEEAGRDRSGTGGGSGE